MGIWSARVVIELPDEDATESGGAYVGRLLKSTYGLRDALHSYGNGLFMIC